MLSKQTLALLAAAATVLLIVGRFYPTHHHQPNYHHHPNHHHNHEHHKNYKFTDSGSRNFTTFMAGTDIPASLIHIAYVSQSRVDQWLVDITNASTPFPTFCNTGNDAEDKAEFAAFLTIIGSETEFAYNFPCSHESGCPDCTHCSYNSNGLECLVDPNLQYFGRGPVQLSWNYNYAAFSEAYFGDNRLVLKPTLLDDDTQLCWASAVWFWMADHQYGGWCMPEAAWADNKVCSADCPEGPDGCSNSSCSNAHWLDKHTGNCHDAMHSSGSIGEVINIINGGYDCCPTTTYFSGFGHTVKRTEWWASIVISWGLGIPWTTLNPVPIQDCPRAVGHIDCSPLKTNPNCWTCCTEV